ncbi:MAG: hypothetical protein U5K69_10005 [Balneolaceae bacterium]|nr:hypothetical protein [Balneolaceae bacterium]
MAQFKANDNKIAVKEVNTRVYSSWTEDKLLFENTPMNQVSKRIEDTFGIKVNVHDSLAGQVLSGSDQKWES